MRIKLTVLLILFCFTSFATRRYWVGGGASTNWNATSPTNWSATSGGTNDASVPSTSAPYDSVYFDGVGTNANQNCNISATSYCQILNTTGYTGTFTTAAVYIRVYGLEITMGSGTVVTSLNINTYSTSGTVLISSNGKTLSAFLCGASASTGTVQLADNLTVSSAFYLQYGTFDLNGKTLTLSSSSTFNSTNNTRTLTSSVSGGQIVFNSAGATPVDISGGTYTVSNPSNFSIKVTAGRTSTNTATYKFGGKTYGNIEWVPGSTGSASNDSLRTFTIFDSNTWSEFKITTPRKYLFSDGTTQTCSSFIASGSETIFCILRGTSTAGWNIVSTAAVCSDYLKLSYSTATGTFNAGINSVNNGGNTGWTFTSCVTDSPYYTIFY